MAQISARPNNRLGRLCSPIPGAFPAPDNPRPLCDSAGRCPMRTRAALPPRVPVALSGGVDLPRPYPYKTAKRSLHRCVWERIMCKVVAYYRVSTARQGRSGLGLEAQRRAVETLCEARAWEIIDSFTEVESGAKSDREELTAALHKARVTGATLVVAKLDRLSRSAVHTLTIRDSGVRVVSADEPDATDLLIGIRATINQEERDLISQRTREALAAAKARGVKLGNPNGAAALRRAGKGNAASLKAIKRNANRAAREMAPVVAELRSQGASSLGQLATALNQGGYQTPRGGRWHPSSVRNLLNRIEAAG